MGRQRTVDDQHFWRSPALQNCTSEDKLAAVHSLTCPDSNIIGAYPVVPRIVAAELGWSQDQWLQVVERLQEDDLVWYDPVRMFIWVRIWWDHHNANQAMGPKLRGRTLENLRRLPEPWQQPFLSDFKARLSDELKAVLNAAWEDAPLEQAISIPYGYGIDMPPNLFPRNANVNSNSTLNLTPTLATTGPVTVDNYGLPAEHREIVDAAVTKAQRAGIATVDAETVRKVVGKQLLSKRPPKDVGAYAYVLAQTLSPVAQCSASPEASRQELTSWKGRCFCWPSDNPTTFIRIEENGFFEYYCLEDGTLKHGHAPIRHGKLLTDLRDGVFREVPPSAFSDIDKGLWP